MATSEKQVMVVGFDDHEHNAYALEWSLKHFFTASNLHFQLVIVHARPSPPPLFLFLLIISCNVIGVLINFVEASEILRYTEADLKRIAARVAENVEEICHNQLENEAVVEVMQGDPRNVLCDAVEKHQASVLVVGSHGYGAIKRAVLGSVSDCCAHHAHCSVMIVKRPKTKH
ncbi:universal stress protein A-like protein [Corylus avellana]|uniref:universal stress protein A-like protein n=1 Tax=Corylus avellana TaxID=13451 RepID=UPI00286ADC54|nr:universal stress protein A-like protein [Corylus avellana]